MVRVLVTVIAFAAATASASSTARAQACDSNLMIVLDRSCSMDDPPNAMETRTKWELAVEAITNLTTTYAGDLNFGLIMFPDTTGANCQQDGPIYVNVAPDNEMAVVAALAATTPTGPCVTNIDTAMAQVASDPVFQGPDPEGRRSFVLLISDGRQSGSCDGDGNADMRTRMTIEELLTNHYPTYVVGFGGEVDPGDLNAFAMAGGVPRAGGPPYYYQADTAMDLAMALDVIAGQSIGDPEFGCDGIPCPDGYCADPAALCTDGVCEVPVPDAGPVPPMPDAAAGGGDGGGGGATGDAGGCDCRTTGRGGSPGAGLVLLLALLVTRRIYRQISRAGST